MTRLRVNLFEHFVFGEHAGTVWDTGPESAKPVRVLASGEMKFQRTRMKARAVMKMV